MIPFSAREWAVDFVQSWKHFRHAMTFASAFGFERDEENWIRFYDFADRKKGGLPLEIRGNDLHKSLWIRIAQGLAGYLKNVHREHLSTFARDPYATELRLLADERRCEIAALIYERACDAAPLSHSVSRWESLHSKAGFRWVKHVCEELCFSHTHCTLTDTCGASN